MNTTGAYGSSGDLQRQNPWHEFLGGRSVRFHHLHSFLGSSTQVPSLKWSAAFWDPENEWFPRLLTTSTQIIPHSNGENQMKPNPREEHPSSPSHP